MDSKDNGLIEAKESFFEKIVNNVKSFLFGNFLKKERQVEEVNENYNENEAEVSFKVESSLNSIVVEKIDPSNDIKTYDNTENVKKELYLQEKLEKLLKENEELEITLNNKFKELKEIRLKELKITLKIYKIEETYLKSYKAKISI